MKMVSRSFLSGIALCAAVAASTLNASAATVDLFDGTFGNLTNVISRPPCAPTPCTVPLGFGPPEATISTGVTTPNADSIKPDNFAIRAGFTWSGSSLSGAGAAILDNALTYNPSVQGAIISLNVSLDKMLTINNTPNPARVLIEQNSNYYLYVSANSPSSTTAGQYTKYTGTGLTALDFTQICLVSCGSGNFGNSNHIGFGPGQVAPTLLNLATGNAIIFGILYTNTFAQGNLNIFYDNFEADITNAAVAATPIPAALPLFASGLGALGFVGWRRKRKAATVA